MVFRHIPKVLLELRAGRVTTPTTWRRRLVTGGAVVRRAYMICDGLCPCLYKEALNWKRVRELSAFKRQQRGKDVGFIVEREKG